MSLRSQIRRVPGARAVQAWQQGRLKQSSYHHTILTLSEGNALIGSALAAGRPYLVGRSGKVELGCVTHYLKARRAGAPKDYPRHGVLAMSNNAGFFPATNDTLDGFAKEYLGAVRQLDAIGMWFNRGENDLVWEFCPRADLVPPMSLEPYCHEDPRSIELAGKRVLVSIRSRPPSVRTTNGNAGYFSKTPGSSGLRAACPQGSTVDRRRARRARFLV